MPMRVMFEENNDPKVEVKTLSFDEIDRVVHYMKDAMHDRVAVKQARSRVKSPHWWDDQVLITGKFTKNEFVARVMDRDLALALEPLRCSTHRPTSHLRARQTAWAAWGCSASRPHTLDAWWNSG